MINIVCYVITSIAEGGNSQEVRTIFDFAPHFGLGEYFDLGNAGRFFNLDVTPHEGKGSDKRFCGINSSLQR